VGWARRSPAIDNGRLQPSKLRSPTWWKGASSLTGGSLVADDWFLGQSTLPLLDNPFSERVNAIVQKTREMRRGVYYPHLYIVKEDGEPPLRLWALSNLIQDRADVLPSYQQYINQLKDRVGAPTDTKKNRLTDYLLQVNGSSY